LIVLLVLALLGFFSRSRFLASSSSTARRTGRRELRSCPGLRRSGLTTREPDLDETRLALTATAAVRRRELAPPP